MSSGQKKGSGMSKEFMIYACAESSMGAERFDQLINEVWSELCEDAMDLKDQCAADPDNKRLEEEFLEASERFLMFGELVYAGQKIFVEYAKLLRAYLGEEGLAALDKRLQKDEAVESVEDYNPLRVITPPKGVKN